MLKKIFFELAALSNYDLSVCKSSEIFNKQAIFPIFIRISHTILLKKIQIPVSGTNAAVQSCQLCNCELVIKQISQCYRLYFEHLTKFIFFSYEQLFILPARKKNRTVIIIIQKNLSTTCYRIWYKKNCHISNVMFEWKRTKTSVKSVFYIKKKKNYSSNDRLNISSSSDSVNVG